MLSRLVLGGLRGVADDVLVDTLWPRAAPASATKTLVGYVHRIRRAMGHTSVVRPASRYVIGPDVAIDVAAVEAEVAAARRAVADRRPGDARAAFAAAEAAFRGEPFDELDDVVEAQQERARPRAPEPHHRGAARPDAA